MAKRKGIRQQLSGIAASGQALEKQVQGLLKQNKHQMALRKLQQGLKRNPEQAIAVTEADIWLSQGKYEFERSRYSQAETALCQALNLEPTDDTYYWLAKCLLAQDKQAEALELFQSAFERKDLPKEMGGCYLKLLVLNGQIDQVQTLIDSQSKRFFAAQLHWARGAIALKSNQPEAALDHFKKTNRPISRADHLAAWTTYAYQQMESWAEAETTLSTGTQGFSSSMFESRNFISRNQLHPALRLLLLYQVAHTHRAPRGFSYVNFDALETGRLSKRDYAGWILELLAFIRDDNVHDAAHLSIEPPAGIMDEYPALKPLATPILLLAGEQAKQQQELECSVEFWGKALEETGFEPNLALNLHKALDLTDDSSKDLKLLDQFIRWLRQEAKHNPQAWPETRLNAGLALLHCWRADAQIYTGRDRDAIKTVQIAEKLAPEHPEVLGRKGLILYTKSRATGSSTDKEESVELLTQALKKGSRFQEIYTILCQALAENPTALKEIRQKYGPAFGDAGAESEVEIPDWVEALGFQHYRTMAQFISDETKTSAPIEACRMFLSAAIDEPSSGQKITLDQEQAVAEWENFLAAHSPTEQVEIIKAIYLIVQQHAKRNQKGIVALQRSYLKKMADLSKQQVPGADVGYLLLQAIASTNPDATTKVVTAVLKRTIEPSKTLAQAQLEIRQFGQNIALKTFIEAQLKKDPQNPLLLLAAATLYKRESAQYDTFYERGFELARRLQDAEALQAYRAEDWWVAQERTRRIVGPNLDRLSDPSPGDMLDLIRQMAREAFGGSVPDNVIDQMLPELIAEMGGGFEEEDEFGFDSLFPPVPRPPTFGKSKGKKSSRRRRF